METVVVEQILKSLHQRGQGVAVLTGVTLKAVAQSRVVVAFSTTAALVAVEDSTLVSGDIGVSLENAIDSFKTKTGDSRSASRGALVVLNNQPVLGALNRLAIERHNDFDRCRDGSGGDLAVIDDLVWQVKKGQSDIIGEVSQSGTRVVEYNRVGGERFVQSGDKSQGESFAG